MRAGILIYHPKLNSILTIYRYKNGQHYYVLPGGQIEESESQIEAAIREIKEELQLTFKPEDLKPAFTYDSDDNQHIYFWTIYMGLENFTIGGEERNAVILKTYMKLGGSIFLTFPISHSDPKTCK